MDFAGQLLEGVLQKIPQLNPMEIDDVIVGCAVRRRFNAPTSGGSSPACGVEPLCPGYTLTRLCSSGLQAIADVAHAIMVGEIDAAVAGGVEYLTAIFSGTPEQYQCIELQGLAPGAYMPMGLTAEIVARYYGVTREEMDRLAVLSHQRAAKAMRRAFLTGKSFPSGRSRRTEAASVFRPTRASGRAPIWKSSPH